MHFACLRVTGVVDDVRVGRPFPGYKIDCNIEYAFAIAILKVTWLVCQ
jgi:hypothetical protein